MKNKSILLISFLLSLLISIGFVYAENLAWKKDGIIITPSKIREGVNVVVSATLIIPEGPTHREDIKIVGGIDGNVIYDKAIGHRWGPDEFKCFFSWTAKEGSHKAFFIIDPSKTLVNKLRSVNKIEKEFTVAKKLVISVPPSGFTVFKLKPDLIIRDVWYLPQDPKCDTKVRMQVAVKNIGAAKCSQPFITAISVQGILAAEIEVPALVPGQEKVVYLDWWILNGAYIRIVPDFKNVIDESNETNNRLIIYAVCKK